MTLQVCPGQDGAEPEQSGRGSPSCLEEDVQLRVMEGSGAAVK